MQKAKYKYIIWDWNGTLYDDVHESLQCVNDMLIKRNMPEITIEQYYSYIDTPIIKFYEHIFDLNIVTYETIVSEYYAGYNKYTKNKILSEKTLALIKKAQRNGISQSIVSSYIEDELLTMIASCGVTEYFDVISGGGDRSVSSKYDRLEQTLQRLNASKSECVIIGDTNHEYTLSNQAGIDCILVGWGHEDPELLKRKECLFAESTEALDKLLFI